MPSSDFDYDDLANESGYQEARKAAGARLGYEAHISRVAYMAAQPFRASREGAWILKELFELMESETGRAPINWDT
jgi:hypothetical protein